MTAPDDDLCWMPSIDVCAICSDSECDGVGCYAGLDPDNPEDQETIERVQALVRAGRALAVANDVLARAENRS
jgi:hypothetical protein